MDPFLKKYDGLMRDFDNASLISVVHVDKSEREHFSDLKKEYEAQKTDLFNAEEYNKIKWDLEAAHRLLVEFRFNGLGNPMIMDLNKQIQLLQSQFTDNISAMVYKFEGETMSPAKYVEIMTTDPNEPRRKAAELVKQQLIPGNLEILTELFRLRQEKANLLGYDTTSKMMLAKLTLKNPLAFLAELVKKIQPVVQRDVRIKSLVLGVPPESLMKCYNRQYYNNLYIKKVQDFDLSKEIYDLEKVVNVVRELYEEILGIQIKRGTEMLWTELEYFQVGNGRIYLDLNYREGKYSHPSEWPYFRHGRDACMVCSFGKIISQRDLVSLFHEFGHCFNVVLNKVPVESVGGTRVETDIVEIPSFYFEKFMWIPEIIQRFGADPETAEKISKCQNTLKAEQVLINASYGIVDIELNDGIITPEKLPERMTELTGIDYRTGNQVTRWVHQVGYECSYYAYAYADCMTANINSNIREYLEYSSAENLERLFGPPNVDAFVAQL